MSTFYMNDEDYVLGETIQHWCGCCGGTIVPQDPTSREREWRHEDPEQVCEEGDDLESPICRVEFLRAWDDGTWDTHIYEVPPKLFHEKATDDARVEWAHRVLGPQAQYRRVVLWAVYSLPNF